MIRRFARPYAQALMNVALASGGNDAAAAVRDDLEAFRAAMDQVPALGRMAANPAVPSEVQQRVLGQVADSLGLGELARRFLGLLLSNYRLHHLPGVLEAYGEMVNRRLGVTVARVTTATELDQVQRASLASALEILQGGEVKIETEVDPSLMAGFTARIGSTLYDGSLKGQLDRLAGKLAEA